MSYQGSKEGASVCVHDYVRQRRVIEVDLDRNNDPVSYLTKEAGFWFKIRNIEPDWWFDDLNNAWFEFDSRGEAMLFILDCLGSFT